MTVTATTFACDSCPNTATVGGGRPPGWGRIDFSAAGLDMPITWDACPTCLAAVLGAAAGAVANPPVSLEHLIHPAGPAVPPGARLYETPEAPEITTTPGTTTGTTGP